MFRVLLGLIRLAYGGNGLTGPQSTPSRQRVIWLLAIAAFSVFGSLLTIVRSNHRMELDVRTTLQLQGQGHPLLERLMGIVSWLGFRPQSLIFPASMVLSFWLSGFRRDARFLLFAWLASLVNYTTKRLVRRPRPSGDGIVVAEADLRDSSFPSGHVMHYLVFWGFFTYLVTRRLPDGIPSWIPVSVIAGMVGSVGPSRIYLGHHWLTDVLGSYSLGSGFLLTFIGLHRRGEK